MKLDESCISDPKSEISDWTESDWRFRISDLRCRIRPISRFCVVLLAFCLLAAPAFATDIRVTDVGNSVVLLHEVFVDYGAFTNDRETEGIRVQQGEAVVVAMWTNIETLTITGKDESGTAPRLKVEVVPRSGAKISATLVSKGRMKLSGKTDLGDYSIDLEKVRIIAPVHTNGQPVRRQ